MTGNSAVSQSLYKGYLSIVSIPKARCTARTSEERAQSWFGLWGPLAPAAFFYIQAGSGSSFIAPELLILLSVGWISICGITICEEKLYTY